MNDETPWEDYFLVQMADDHRKHIPFTHPNHRDERCFTTAQKKILVLSLVASGDLTGEIGTDFAGNPDYRNIELTEKGMLKVHMINL